MDNTVYLNKFNGQHTLTVTVKITNRFKVRIWIALKLMWLGSKVIGMNYEQETID